MAETWEMCTIDSFGTMALFPGAIKVEDFIRHFEPESKAKGREAFEKAICMLLETGWEPYAAFPMNADITYCFRRKAVKG